MILVYLNYNYKRWECINNDGRVRKIEMERDKQNRILILIINKCIEWYDEKDYFWLKN